MHGTPDDNFIDMNTRSARQETAYYELNDSNAMPVSDNNINFDMIDSDSFIMYKLD